jgi:cytoskeletal protein RodZ
MGKTENTGTAEPAAETPVQSPRQHLLTQIGQKLIQAREDRDEQLSVVTRKLRLSKVHLQALEAGNWDDLPDDVYALGFLRQYSRYLALDLDDEIQRIKHDQYILTRPLTFPDLPVAPSNKWAWIAGTAFVVLFVVFNIVNRDAIWDLLVSPKTTSPKAEQTEPDSTESSLAANTDRAASLASDNIEEAATKPTQKTESTPVSTMPEMPPAAEQSPTGTAPASAAPTAPADSVSASIETQPQTDTPESSPGGEATTTLTTASTPASIIDLAGKPVLAAGSEETTGLTGNDAAIHHFRFEAVTESVWLQIFLPDETGEAKGEMLKEVLLQPGYHSNVKEAVDSLWITCGNPSALRITVDGQVQAEVGSLGDVGKVLRDYQFKIDQQNNN